MKRCGAEIDVPRIVDLVTGPTAERQRPGHAFFRELVNILPEAASYLLYAVEDINPRAPGGLRLNVLTATLLAVKDAEMERRGSKLNAVEMEGLRNGVAEALASLLHRNVLSSFNQWELEGSTDRVSATVAWLIRAVGWVADADDHQAMRMIENLSFAIQSIPDRERDWGIDSADVVQGFEWIREKQPELWKMYGQSLESAATEVGSWRAWPGFAVGQRVRERKGASIVESNDGARDAILNVEVAMRTTVTLDDDLLARAEELTGVRERSALIRDAVELLARIECGRQRAGLGGSDSAAEAAPRSRERA